MAQPPALQNGSPYSYAQSGPQSAYPAQAPPPMSQQQQHTPMLSASPPYTNSASPMPPPQQHQYPPQPQMPPQGQYPQQAMLQEKPPGFYQQQVPVQLQGQFVPGNAQQPQLPPQMAYSQQPMTQTAIPLATGPLGPTATVLECPKCHARSMSKTEYINGGCTHGSAICCGLSCLCCLPYMMECFKDVRHVCPNCGHPIATWKRSSDRQNLQWAMMCVRCFIAAEQN